MSKENVQTIIGRAIMETEYRSLLFSDPGKALEGYDLTAEEAQSLKSLDHEKFDVVANQVEERISKSGLGFQEIAIKLEVSFRDLDPKLGQLFRFL